MPDAILKQDKFKLFNLAQYKKVSSPFEVPALLSPPVAHLQSGSQPCPRPVCFWGDWTFFHSLMGFGLLLSSVQLCSLSPPTAECVMVSGQVAHFQIRPLTGLFTPLTFIMAAKTQLADGALNDIRA